MVLDEKVAVLEKQFDQCCFSTHMTETRTKKEQEKTYDTQNKEIKSRKCLRFIRFNKHEINILKGFSEKLNKDEAQDDKPWNLFFVWVHFQADVVAEDGEY